MASSVIHMCVAKKIDEKLNIKEKNLFLLGSIAPDISKLVGEERSKSHFYNENENVDINKFLNKYEKDLSNPFMLGYFVHLYTDFLWEKYFMSEIIQKDSITKLDGSKVPNTDEMYKKLIYNDYTNLNILLIDEYKLDLSLFYNKIELPNIVMDEIPINKLNILIDKAGVIIENSKENKAFTFKLENIKPFIKLSSDLILSIINEKKYYNL